MKYMVKTRNPIPAFLTSFKRLMRQRGTGAEGKELVQELSPAPLHKRRLSEVW
jgi:hypothetical protein